MRNLFCQLLVRLLSSGISENQTVCKQAQECGIPTLGNAVQQTKVSGWWFSKLVVFLL